ncbi:hypothetical protein A2U01_0038080, partial [Trifolium medium]|nr:hypothetical protein [Trifolium medium]
MPPSPCCSSFLPASITIVFYHHVLLHLSVSPSLSASPPRATTSSAGRHRFVSEQFGLRRWRSGGGGGGVVLGEDGGIPMIIVNG